MHDYVVTIGVQNGDSFILPVFIAVPTGVIVVLTIVAIVTMSCYIVTTIKRKGRLIWLYLITCSYYHHQLFTYS